MRKTLDGLITLVSCMVTYSAPAGVASALLWGFLTPGTESSFVDTWRVPLLILLVTFLACVVCGLAGRFQHNAYSVNGCGTTFYGSDEAGPDAVTTKWLTSWGLPLLPIRSYRLVDIALEPGGMPLFLTRERMRLQPLPGIGLQWDQVLRTWLKEWGIAALILGGFAILILWQANRPHRTLFW